MTMMMMMTTTKSSAPLPALFGPAEMGCLMMMKALNFP